MLTVVVPAVARAQTCFTDVQGADDQPGQKDLNEYCSIGPCSGGFSIAWNFDDTRWTGGNSGDACALFDSDGDGNANNAVCGTLTNGSADGTIPSVLSATTCYSCGDDRPDRCTGAVVISCTSTCSVAYTADPFIGPTHGSNKCTGPTALHDCTQQDDQVTCCIKPSEFGGTAVLTDVCSFPSSQPNSDPSDCVINPPACQNDADCNDNNPCTVDTCDPSLRDCHHTSAPSTTVCRSAAGVCDVAEFCTGSSPTCPADAKVSPGTICRAAAGVCDVAETC